MKFRERMFSRKRISLAFIKHNTSPHSYILKLTEAIITNSPTNLDSEHMVVMSVTHTIQNKFITGYE